MKLTFEPPRLTGLAILAVAGATALSVGACSSSNNAKSPATSSPAAAHGKAVVRGLVASVSGNAVQVTENTGTATVDVSPSTKVTEYATAQLTDIAAGNCVSVIGEPAPPPGGPVTAATVKLNPQGGDGKCPQPKTGPRKVIGTLASVAGNTINVTVTDANGNPAQTAVTVTDKTHYAKGASATSQAVAQGKCITAQGTKDGGGTLQATVIAVGPANNGKCPQPAAKKQHPH
ncbi:MAG: DUF5666 domain-containing protein [Mycobacterium sp.]